MPAQAAELIRQPGWISDYVQEAIGRAMPALEGVASSYPEIFETHNFVIVKIKLPAGTDNTRLELKAKADRLQVAGIPGRGVLEQKLPCLVAAPHGRALVRNGVLQIKLRKLQADNRYWTIGIRSE